MSRRTRRWYTGLFAVMLFIAQVVMPVQAAFATMPDDKGKPAETVKTDEPKKVYVCKYVGTPGTDERLQTGNNPIEVSVNAIQNNQWNGTVPGWFSDAHDRSYVLGYVPMSPEPSVADCPSPTPDRVTIPVVTPTDPCGPNNASWTKPADSSLITWELTAGRLIARTTGNLQFTDGTTMHDYGLAQDSGVLCPTVKPCTVSAGSMTVSRADQFADYQDTRTKGHYDFTSNGLKVYTDDNSSQAKVAWYHVVDYPLSQVGEPSMSYVSTFGIKPGMQISLDKDGNGTADGILVGEPDFYGNNWWSNANFGISSGMGYTSYGTLNDYLAANPNAVVRAVGFSLGSGVYASGVLKSLTFGCYTWTFKYQKTATPVAPVAVDPCGRLQDKFIIKPAEGVDYYIGGIKVPAGTYPALTNSVTVTAKAKTGYVLEGASSWTLTFTNEYCEPAVNVKVSTFCKDEGQKFTVKLQNPTMSSQRYEVVVTDDTGTTVASDIDTALPYLGSQFDWLATKDGTYTVSVYSYNDGERGALLYKTDVVADCATDRFTPQIYKKDQYGTIITSARFTVEVCQGGELTSRFVMPDLMTWKCRTYTDVNFGTDGTWFKDNVEHYKHNKPTKVTITESYTPPACTGTGPWTFTWDYDRSDDESLIAMTYGHGKSGSWSNGSNVWTLVNNCTQGQGGVGGDTPTPTPTPTPVSGQGAAGTLPAELPMTGPSGTLSTWFGLLAALITYGAVYFLQPKKRLED